MQGRSVTIFEERAGHDFCRDGAREQGTSKHRDHRQPASMRNHVQLFVRVEFRGSCLLLSELT